MSRGSPPLAPGAKQAQEWWMVPVREAPLRGRLLKIRDTMDQRMAQLREEFPDGLHSTYEAGAPSVLSFFPEVLNLFEKKPAVWFERRFGDFPPPEWDGRVLPARHADVVHFAEVYGLGLLARLDVYVGNGYSFLKYLEDTLVTKEERSPYDLRMIREILNYPFSQAAANQGAFRLSSAPILAIDFFPKRTKAGRWIEEEYAEVKNIPFFECHDYEQIACYSSHLLEQISKRGKLPSLDHGSFPLWPVFLSPAVRRHLDIALFGKLQLVPIDTLGLVPTSLLSAMEARGFYPRSHLARLTLVDGRLTGSLGCCFHDEGLRLATSGYRTVR